MKKKIPIFEPFLNKKKTNYNLTNCIKTNWISSQGVYIKDFEKTYDKMSPWVKKKVENNNKFRKDLNRVRKVRLGADKLIKEYNIILKQLGNRYRAEILKRA